MKRTELNRDFYSTFMGYAKDIKAYVKFLDKQEKDTMVKFSRSACLYQIMQYYECIGIVMSNYFNKKDTVNIHSSYRKRVESFSEDKQISKQDKNVLLAISKVRNRLIHEPDMSSVEKIRLESKLIEYFKDEWFLHLVKGFYETYCKNVKPMQLC
ncbi:hypothetical protein UT300012_22910 [Paraclostridium bifermentans]